MLSSAYSYLLAVSQDGSFSRAAKRLCVSQPALSAAISRLEQSLGAQLIDRTATPLSLTPAGEIYLDYCKSSERLDEQLYKQLADLDGLNSGKLTVGGSSCFNSGYLPEVTADFLSRYPNIELNIIDGRIPEIARMTLAGEADIFITPAKIDSDGLKMLPLLNEKLFICVPPDSEVNPLLDGCEVPFRDIVSGVCRKKKYPCADIRAFEGSRFVLLGDDQHVRRIADMYFERYSFVPEGVLTVSQMMTSFYMTLAGAGVSFMTESALRYGHSSREPRFYCFDDDISRRTLCVAYKKGGYLSRAAQEYIRLLRAYLDDASLKSE